ncbi:hypothetical protein GF354_02685 [Candidatus Peregrinibacteria bacterium]|nr:hypothetical protein [Candidatus Peregrinibacteria bacterium]
MNYRDLISEAWVSTQQNKRLIIWFGFIPSILTTSVGIGYLTYQFFAFKQSPLFADPDGESFLHDVILFIWDFLQTHVSLTLPLVIIAIVFAIIYLLFPTLAKASAIQIIARKRNNQPSTMAVGLKHGILSFLPLFEYHLLIKTFSFFTIIFEVLFVLRNLPLLIFKVLLPAFVIIILISLGISLLFVYTDFYIVVDGEGVIDSIKKSSRLVFTNLKHTFLIMILMLIIGVRIVIQAVMVFTIPAMILLISGYIATVTLPVTGLIIGGIVGAIALILASYLNGIVDIFSYTVWTYTFLELSSEEEVSAREVFEDDIGEHKKTHVEHKNL